MNRLTMFGAAFGFILLAYLATRVFIGYKVQYDQLVLVQLFLSFSNCMYFDNCSFVVVDSFFHSILAP